MTQPVNPFAAAVPQQAEPPVQQPAAPPANPYAQQAVPAPVQAYAPQQQPAPAPSPFGAAVPQQQAPATTYGTGPVAQTIPQYGAPQQQVQQWAGTAQYAPQAPIQQAPAPVQQQWQAPAAPPVGPPPAFGQATAAPAPVIGGATGAKLADMYSRLVIMFPLAVERVPRNPKYISDEDRAKGNTHEDKMTTTVIVLDSGPGTPPGQGVIDWGGNPHELGGLPHTNRDSLPYVRKGMWINQTRLVSQGRGLIPVNGSPATPMVGRLAKTGPESKAPWYLVGATEAELAVANQYLQAVAAGHLPHPLA